ncbi:MAG: hypothetical protein AMJ79_10940 [Phycisphaerae bacterium SM23_30]|nr:MAG: hypothetical protein AMJ79_10940 [Phycisphaerae bacterium SM23_30]
MIAHRERRIKIARGRKFDTIAAHGIYDPDEAIKNNNASIMEPVYLTPAQVYHNSAELEAGLAYEMPNWCYSRYGNPSNTFLEETFALLESYGSEIEATCLATSSGMSALRIATDPLLVKDDSLPPPNIVSSYQIYGGTYQQFWVRRREEQGIEVRWVFDPTDLNEWSEKVDEGTRFLFGEFPSNPICSIFDIEQVARLAHQYQIPLIVDATCASPALTRPLLHGADIVYHSASKIICSSGTSIVGLLTARKNIPSRVGDDEMKADFAAWVKLWPFRDNGPGLHPIAAILTLHDLRTLRMKVAQMSRTALKVSQFLEDHPKVETVHYPGLKSFPAHDIAKKYMKLVDSDENSYGFMLAVDTKEDHPGDSTKARQFYDALQLIIRATDLGKVKTVATLNAISTHKQQGEEARKLSLVRPSTCRISCGIEDADDLIGDLEQALDKI